VRASALQQMATALEHHDGRLARLISRASDGDFAIFATPWCTDQPAQTIAERAD
jgi:hypothetical protein